MKRVDRASFTEHLSHVEGHVEVYKRDDGKWAWRRAASNDRVVSTDGGQGYERQRECVEMALRLNRDVEVFVLS